MKVFYSNNNDMWKNKVNFVDDNNVYVGYDMSQQCCENTGWFISNTIVSKIPENPIQSYDLDGYQFNTSFFSEGPWNTNINDDYGIFTCIITFKIIKVKAVKYLNLYSSHNRYYTHGFEMLKNDLIIKKGVI